MACHSIAMYVCSSSVLNKKDAECANFFINCMLDLVISICFVNIYVDRQNVR